ncbi:hypothetical protein ACHHYP_02882 [Achlya hypogyna]|uniref:PH domain-containing protein n=1 Tax=Achlya hypogyna TaxID=1202772 RepID=A0A1V9ZRL0_ACHHY|nr:hypothetical protein ACHHYP_02882 [Achlya hypogyna]
MVVYYTRRYSSLLDKCGWRRAFVALEVHPDVGLLVCLNTNAHYPLDAIAKVQWHANLKVSIAVPDDHSLIVKFESPDALRSFLLHLDVAAETDAGGHVVPGVYVNPAVGALKAHDALATTVLSSMRLLKARGFSRKERSGSSASRTSAPWVVA